METLRQQIDAEAAINTHKRTGWLMEVCIDDAKMKHGVWAPEDTLPVVARFWAKRHPKLAIFLIKIYYAMNGEKEVTQ